MREVVGPGSRKVSVVDAGAAAIDPGAARLGPDGSACEPSCVAVGPSFSAPLTSVELALRRREDVYRLALPILESSARNLASSHGILCFLDVEGWRLWVGGDLPVLDRLPGMRLVPGTRCDRAAATLGGGTARGCRGVEEDEAALESELRSWRCSAPIVLPGTGERIGIVCTGDPRTSHDVRAPIAARAIAHAIADRLRSARLVRDHVIAFALQAATAAGEGALGVDHGGRVVAANDAARRQLGFEALDVPEPVRSAVASALDSPAWAGRELAVDLPGGPRLRFLASPVRYEDDPVGGVVRVLARDVARTRGNARSRTHVRASARYTFRHILGESPSIRAALAFAQTASRNDLPVVLNGESGTGKELFAQAIHTASSRRDGPFVAVNCGSIPAGLCEAELFGYEPGTFTDACREGRPGKFEQAGGGTIFLDEVSELSPAAQTALLRVLQEREIVRLGSSRPRPIDVRVLAATNRPLDGEIRAGRFRADLFFRLNVLTIAIPSLRERRQDVPILARDFLALSQAEVGRPGLAFSDDALRALAARGWPGNVRELRNVVLRSAATAPGTTIGARDLLLEPCVGDEARLPPDDTAAGTERERAPMALARDGEQRRSLLNALEASSWNVARAARILSVSRMTLYRWLRKHGIAR